MSAVLHNFQLAFAVAMLLYSGVVWVLVAIEEWRSPQ